MNYLLFANPDSGSPIVSLLMKEKAPKVVITNFMNIDFWKRLLLRFLKGNLTVEDKMRLFYKKEFYDYRSLNIKRLEKIIKNNNIEIGFITTFSHIIPKQIIDLFPKGLYNLHPSLLPLHGGANPIMWVIKNKDEFTGTTCHLVTETLDHGDVFYQTKYAVGSCGEKDLKKKYAKDCVFIILEILNNFDRVKLNSKKMERVIYD